MRVLGVDPGIANTGYGVVYEEKGSPRALAFGSIRTKSGARMDERLAHIYEEMMALIEEYSPDVLALERLFFSANKKTAGAVGEARGVIILACFHSSVPYFEYAPLEVKMAIVGYGNAPKSQVRYMVSSVLGLPQFSPSFHAADALAIALCHLQMNKVRSKIEMAKKR